MRRLSILLLLLALPAFADEARVKRLIAGLAAEDPVRRDAASEELREMARQDDTGAVERLLVEASGSPDAEVAARADQILAWLRAGDRLVVVAEEGTGAIDVLTGKYAWEHAPAGSVWADPRRPDPRAWLGTAGSLECVDLRTGQSRWVVEVPERGQVCEGAWWIGLQEDRVARFALATGEKQWERAIQEGNIFLCDERAVFVEDWLEDEMVLALEASTGKELWHVPGGLLAHDPRAVYVKRPGEEATVAVAALERESGRVRWSFDLPNDARSPSVHPGAGDLVLVEDGGGLLYALGAKDGKPRWSGSLGVREVWAVPDGSRAWLLDSGTLSLVSLADGKELAALKLRTHDVDAYLDGDILLRPLRDGNVLYLASAAEGKEWCCLEAFDLEKRALLWRTELTGLAGADAFGLASLDLARRPAGLVVVLKIQGHRSLEVVDPGTGAVLVRHHLGGESLEVAPYPWTLPAPVARTRQALKQKVTMQFEGEPLAKVCERLGAESGIVFRVRDEAVASRPVKISVSGLELGALIGLVRRLCEAELGIDDAGAVVIGAEIPPEANRAVEVLDRLDSIRARGYGDESLAERRDALIKRAGETVLEVSFRETPLRDVVRDLHRKSDIWIAERSYDRSDSRITLAAKAPLAELVRQVAGQVGYGIAFDEDDIMLCDEERRDSLEAEWRERLQEVAEILQRPLVWDGPEIPGWKLAREIEAQTEVPVITTEEIWDPGQPLSVPAGRRPLREILEHLSLQEGLRWHMEDKTIYLFK